MACKEAGATLDHEKAHALKDNIGTAHGQPPPLTDRQAGLTAPCCRQRKTVKSGPTEDAAQR